MLSVGNKSILNHINELKLVTTIANTKSITTELIEVDSSKDLLLAISSTKPYFRILSAKRKRESDDIREHKVKLI